LGLHDDMGNKNWLIGSV